MKKANAEGWAGLRKQTDSKSTAKAQQKAADAAASNAVIAQRLKQKMLLRLEREFDNLPDERIGSASFVTNEKTGHDKNGKPTKSRSGIEFKLRDLAATYQMLTADIMPEQQNDSEILSSIFDVLNRRRDEHD